ncbi:MAG: NAD-dependent epimerase/dehydratase family protein [Planctomycetes bacterium]|nr:NAD-dependent epimerase/dehydratase family protein [Planctomycetota bacterium]
MTLPYRHVLVTGGAGFVGSRLCLRLRREFEGLRVTALDNLVRRGSELHIRPLREHGVDFVHGDIRCPEDLAALPAFDLLLECSAEPSVHAGQSGSPVGVVHNNLTGALHCLEAARQNGAAVLFLSTSRVYPIAHLRALRHTEAETRLELTAEQELPGCSHAGIAEGFPLDGARSFYGMTKLAGEALIQEYVFTYGMRALIDRCGVIAGPGQMGKADQGVVTLWAARHVYGRPLKYIGFGGHGKQVRDVLHVDDLCDLVVLQLQSPSIWDGRIYNAGGGAAHSASLLELTGLCRELSGQKVEIASEPATAAVDVPIYVTDNALVERELGWQPRRDVPTTLGEILAWIRDHRDELRPVLDS